MENVYRKFRLTAVLAMVLGLVLSAARADVKVETMTHFGGIAGVGASDIHSVQYYQGDKNRSESSVKFTGAVLGSMQKWMNHSDSGNGSITIYRVGENRMLTLNPDKRTYSEQPIYMTTPQEKQEKASSYSSSPSQQEKSGKDEVRVVKSELKVEATGKTRVVNGFNIREYLVTWNLETENIKSHERGRSLLTAELWNSDDARFAAARKDEDNYNRAYAKLFRMSMPTDVAKQYGMQQMAFLTANDMKSFSDKMSQIKGYPVVTDVKWEAGCIGNCPKDEESEPQEQQSSGSSGGLGGMLGGLLAKKAERKIQSPPQQSADGITTIFTSHTEVQSIDNSGLPSSLFQVPVGYSKS